LDQAACEHPEIARVPVTRPLVVTGLLRSGTTLVQNLLAQHPGLRSPDLWELMSPVTAGGRGPDATDAEHEAIADAAQAYVDEYYQVAPDLRMIHFLDARRPDECHRLTGNAFTTMVYEMRYRIPGYAAWSAGHDHAAAYRFHREQMRAILWRRPGGPAVFKDPFHLWQLPALVSAYPDARIVHLHRDPAVTIPSTCSLCVTVRGARTDELDRTDIGRQWRDNVAAAVDALPVVRKQLAADAPDAAVLDVRYRDLMADPVATLGAICEFAGAPLTDAAERAMRDYLAANPATRHGSHRYAAADFGLDETDLGRQFAGYRDDYGL
ncbi:MAG: sulfotransferase, partial [Actinocatenispora sp.]